jgi:hypothetical protein
MEQIKIAAIGCWNRRVQEDGNIPMEYVIKNIKENENDFNHLVVLGDNYYANKTKIKIGGVPVKIVDHQQHDLEYGFSLIENLKPKKYLIMGNHDIEDTLDKDCIGLKSQVSKKTNFNVMFPFNSEIITLSDGTKIKYIFIDTTIYRIKADPSCYDSVVKKNSNEIKQEQNDFIVNELNDSSIKHFMIFAHEPLYSVKTKILEEDKEKLRVVDDTLDHLAEIILNNSRGKNVFYVCADVHMYQSGIVIDNFGNSVKQIVCGTGGAEKDSLVLDEKLFNKKNLTYCVDITKDSYGYVEIIINSKEIKHRYINVSPDGQVHYFNKKYLIQY